MKIDDLKHSVDRIMEQVETELKSISYAPHDSEYVQSSIRQLRSQAYAVLLRKARSSGIAIEKVEAEADELVTD